MCFLVLMIPLAGTAEFKPTGQEELDAIRRSMSADKTNIENYKLNIFTISVGGFMP